MLAAIRPQATAIHLGGRLLYTLERPTRRRGRQPRNRTQHPVSREINLGRAALLRLPIWSCTAESLPSHRVSPPALVGSYIKPLEAPPFHPSPVPCCVANSTSISRHPQSAPRPSHRLVCFLLHLSSGRPAWPLASPLPFGVRTFLPPHLFRIRMELFKMKPATARPTPNIRTKYITLTRHRAIWTALAWGSQLLVGLEEVRQNYSQLYGSE